MRVLPGNVFWENDVEFLIPTYNEGHTFRQLF